MEEWKDIPSYEGYYQISTDRRVKSLKRYVEHPRFGRQLVHEKIIKSHRNYRGYVIVLLSKNTIKKTLQIHKLMALAFLPNPECKKTINHKNGIRHDNRLDNLEWATNSENQKHAFKYGKQYTHNARLVLDMQSGVFFYSIREAARSKSISYHSLSDRLTGKCENNSYLILI